MNTTICLFLLFGAGFGLVTYTNRHLFSEGPTQRGADPDRGWVNGRLVWMLLCTFLWPILALTGLNSALLLALLLARRRAKAARVARQPGD